MAEPPAGSKPPKPASTGSGAPDNSVFSEELSREFELAPDASMRSIDTEGKVERLSEEADAPPAAQQPSSAVSLLELPEEEGHLELVERSRSPGRAAPRDGMGIRPVAKADEGSSRGRGLLIGVGSLLALLLIASVVGWFRAKRPAAVLTLGYPVTVDSEPPGADILVDGQPTGKKTPATLASWDWVMPHEIALKLDGHATYRQLIAEGPHTTTVNATLARVAFVDLDSVPAGVEVRRGEFKVGTTPGHFEIMAGTKDILSLHQAGYLPSEQELNAAPGETLTRSVVLAPAGTLNLDSDPEGVQVMIDDHLSGETPLTIQLEAKRPHHLRLTAPGLIPEQRKVTLEQGKSENLSVLLGDEMDRELRGLLSKAERRLRAAEAEMRRLDDPNQSREFFRAMARNRKHVRLESEIDALEAKTEQLRADLDSHRSAIEDRLEKKDPQ